MVPLKTKEIVVGKDKTRAALWEAVIQNCLGSEFIPIIQKLMVGCFIIMFVNKKHKNKVKNIRKVKVKTGLSGMTGNKGSVAIRFNFEDTSFSFINNHLESGQNAVGERLEQVRQVYNATYTDFSVCQTQEHPYHDYKCFMGDMNFRISLPNHEIRELIP